MEKLFFTKLIQEGSHYQVGYERGKYITSIPEYYDFMTKQKEGEEPLNEEIINRKLELLEYWCPGVVEELRGMADGMAVRVDQLFLMYEGYKFPKSTKVKQEQEKSRGCSQVCVMPSRSENGHTLMARSYEFSPEDELIYSVTRVPGRFAHVGFSLFQVGRFDGMNEKGLCVTMSSCECVHFSDGEGEGVAFYIAIRRILDSCSTTQEALNLLEKMPICHNMNIMITDITGDCVVLEVLNSKGSSNKAIRRQEGYLCSFNHYQSKQYSAIYPQRMVMSDMREHLLDEFFCSHTKVSLTDLKQLLTTRLPRGLCCHAYGEWFGTLRSMLYDVTESKLWICFGSPESGTWFEADLGEKAGIEVIEVGYENENAPAEYWNLV